MSKENLEDQIVQLIREVSGTDMSSDDLKKIHLYEYGVIDSLTFVHFIIGLEKLCKIQIEFEKEDFMTFSTVEKTIEWINKSK